jgi:hypothetical protein
MTEMNDLPAIDAVRIRRLHGATDAELDGLARVLIDCVEGGASVSFMQPMTRERARPSGAAWPRA